MKFFHYFMMILFYLKYPSFIILLFVGSHSQPKLATAQIPLLWSALLCIIPKQNNSQSKMASLQPKNSGGPITKFWDAPETIATLEHVKGWLCKHAKKVSLDLWP